MMRAPARFTIQRRLGSGGFGVVYEAYDRERQTVVALKELTRNDPAALYRFKREFRTLTDLAHPNLVTLYELISDQDQWLLAMELIRGVNFLEYVHDAQALGAVPGFSSTPSASETAPTVASGDPVDGIGRDRPVRPMSFRPDLLRSGLRQLADGVRHLHHHGILHRDIKPSNVLVTKDGRVVLLDFGLATESTVEQQADTLGIAGTPEYMSPEQAAGKPLTEASDWYSVGVVLYLALTGHPPFTGSFLTMLLDKQRRDPVPPRELVRNLPDDLESLCCDLLRRDPATRPSSADILERLSGESSAPVRSATQSRSRRAHPFVGREQQLAVMREAYQAARGGKAVTLYLRGSSGMGKTALVRHFLHTIREKDDEVVVLAGRCYEQEAVPYKALDSLVDALAVYLRTLPRAQAESLLPRGMWALARVFPVLKRVDAVMATPHPIAEIRDSHELRRRASTALREMLGRLAERHPLILFIDDLQWGDVDSASLLTDLLSPPDQPALLVIACYRGEEAETSPVLRMLLALQPDRSAGDVKTVDVGELSPPEADELVHSLVGDDDVSNVRADVIARESGGHPFFIDQLIRYGHFDPTATSLDSVLLGRAARLPATSRALLEVTAVAGRPIDIAVANKAADLESGDYNVVTALRAGQFVRTRVTNTREIEPYHDRVRETIVGSLAPDTLKRHHHRLALSLEESGRADPETLAVHFRGAGDVGQAAHYALAAAEQAAAALAFERAARLYRVALDLQPGEPSERHRLWMKLGDALANGGRVIEAAQAYLTAAQGADAGERRELQRQAAEQFLMGGYLDQGLKLLRSVLSAAGLSLPATSRRALLWILLRRPYMLLRGTKFRERAEREIPADELWRVDLCHSAVRSLGFTETMFAIEFQMRHLLLALKVGEPYRVARALGFEAIADARDRGSRPRAERLLETVKGLVDRVPAAHKADATANIHVTVGMLAFLAGRWKTASVELQQAEHMFREQSALPYKLVVVQVYTLSALYQSGQLLEYFRRIPECLKESLDRGNAFAEANLRLQNAHRRCFGDDQPAGALEELQEARARWSPRGFLQVHASELFHRGDFALYCGDARTAWDTLTNGWPRLSQSHLLRLQTIRIMALYVRARAWLATAEAGFETADMALHAAVARHARGALTGGDEGRALMGAANRWMTEQGVRNPARMHAMHAPNLHAP
jgi:serine/threonine protein kinase